MFDITAVREHLFDMTQTLVHVRFHMASVAAGLETDLDEEEENPEIGDLRADVECLLFDHFDPMLRSLLAAAADRPRARIMEAALDIACLRSRLRLLAASLPRSPEEDNMLDGKALLDEPTDLRLTLNAVVEDQLDQALDNLLSPSGAGLSRRRRG